MEKMNNTEKKSKKTFSKDPVHNTSEFQVENMKHKIKSVKKKKKKMYNYKNIEELENIHDNDVDSSNDKIIEGMPPTNPIAQFTDDDFEGGEDDIYEPDNSPSSEAPKSDKKGTEEKSTKETINDFFSNPDKFGDNVVEALIRGFSVENVPEKDKEIIKNYIYSFFSIIIAFYLTLNLCITMFLRIDGKRLGIAEYDPYDKNFDTVCVSVGTGCTLSGVIESSNSNQFVLGFLSLNHKKMKKEILKYTSRINWNIIDNYIFKGYAKVNQELINFINDFYKKYKIPLDPIYNSKMVFGIFDMVKKNKWNWGKNILVINSGGLQGVEGMNSKLEERGCETIKF